MYIKDNTVYDSLGLHGTYFTDLQSFQEFIVKHVLQAHPTITSEAVASFPFSLHAYKDYDDVSYDVEIVVHVSYPATAEQIEKENKKQARLFKEQKKILEDRIKQCEAELKRLGS